MDEILRKYIRYVLNEKPFNPNVVVDLISLRKVSQLNDTEVAEVLNEISRRIVKDKGMFHILLFFVALHFMLYGILISFVYILIFD